MAYSLASDREASYYLRVLLLEAVDKKKAPTPIKNEINEKKIKNENEKEDKSCDGACLGDLARYGVSMFNVFMYVHVFTTM
jgi:hypothetical protein